MYFVSQSSVNSYVLLTSHVVSVIDQTMRALRVTSCRAHATAEFHALSVLLSNATLVSVLNHCTHDGCRSFCSITSTGLNFLELQALQTDLRVQVDDLRMCIRLACNAKDSSDKNAS
jgi:hypothetical protein